MSLSRREFLRLCAAGLLAGIPCREASAEPAGTDLVLLGGTLLACNGAAPVEHCGLRIRGGRIAAVGRRREFEAAPAAEILDLRLLAGPQACILPGLIDAHMHRCFGPRERREVYLRRGVTSVCDLGSPLAAMRELAKDRDGLGRPTATAYFSGPALTAPGGYPGPLHGRDFGLEVRGEAEAARAVERLAGLGARVVKVALEPGPQGRWPMPGPGELAAAVREARLLGLPVHAHVEDLAALPLAVEAGVDVVEHLPCRATDAAGPRPLFSGDPADPELPAEYEELLSRMAGRGVAATPTLSAAARATWNDAGINKAVRRFVALGGQVAAGSDAPYRGVEPGLPLGEYELLLRAGLTPAQVLEAATRVAAKVCGRARELGTVEPGRIADLIVLAGNPLDDIANLRRLALVIKDGAVAHAAALD